MTKFIAKFCKREDGAVTIDWVVLTALVVGLAFAAFSSIEGGVATLTASIQALLESFTAGG